MVKSNEGTRTFIEFIHCSRSSSEFEWHTVSVVYFRNVHNVQLLTLIISISNAKGKKLHVKKM